MVELLDCSFFCLPYSNVSCPHVAQTWLSFFLPLSYTLPVLSCLALRALFGFYRPGPRTEIFHLPMVLLDSVHVLRCQHGLELRVTTFPSIQESRLWKQLDTVLGRTLLTCVFPSIIFLHPSTLPAYFTVQPTFGQIFCAVLADFLTLTELLVSLWYAGIVFMHISQTTVSNLRRCLLSLHPYPDHRTIGIDILCPMSNY